MSECADLRSINALVEHCLPGEWGIDPVGGASNCVVYRATDIDNEGHLRHDEGAERVVLLNKVTAKALKANDIIVEASGGAPDKPVGRVALFAGSSRKPALVSNFFRAMRPRAGVDAKFLTFQLVALNRSSAIWRYQQQTTGLINLKVTDYLKHRVWMPALSVQQKIAAILTSLDTAIEKTEALIEKHQQIKAGLMHDLFTRGVLPNGQLRPPREQAPELYRETRSGWIPREWTLCQLGDIASVSRGKFTHRPRNDPAFLGGPFPFIQTGDVAAVAGEAIHQYSQTLSAKGASVSACFPAQTIAVTIAANIADTAILAVPMYFPDSVVGVVVGPTVDTRFVELSIRRAKPRLNALAPQSAQKNINLKDLRPLEMPVAPLAEQREIAARYEAAQSPIDMNAKLLLKLRAQKLGLMQDLLTGKVPVKVERRISEPTDA